MSRHPPVWVDGYFGTIRSKSDDIMSAMSVLTNQKSEWRDWVPCLIQAIYSYVTPPVLVLKCFNSLENYGYHSYCVPINRKGWRNFFNLLQNYLLWCVNIVVLLVSLYKPWVPMWPQARHVRHQTVHIYPCNGTFQYGGCAPFWAQWDWKYSRKNDFAILSILAIVSLVALVVDTLLYVL